MYKKFIPTYFNKTIFEIDFNKVKSLGYKTLFIDLDNTLESPYIYTPSDKVIDLINNLKKLGFNIIILSNNKEPRVSNYCKNLNVTYFYDVKKPYLKRISKIIKENNIDLTNALSIGDQVMTDVFLANKLNIDVILLEPLTIKDEPITFIPRLLDRHFKKIIKRKHLAKEI